jgi:hypothetical protein
VDTSFRIHNFIADTSILAVIAYLLSRGRMVSLLFRERLSRRETLQLGLTLGVVGLLEAIFPGPQFPYVPHTLFVTFAAIAGGLPIGLIASIVVTIGLYCVQTPQLVYGTMLAVLVSAFLGRLVPRAAGIPMRLLGGFAAATLTEACRLFIHDSLIQWPHFTVNSSVIWMNAVANGCGVALLILIVSDAQVRDDSERAHRLVSQAQLAALRVRIHPHFLFNTLNSIAELERTVGRQALEVLYRQRLLGCYEQTE